MGCRSSEYRSRVVEYPRGNAPKPHLRDVPEAELDSVHLFIPLITRSSVKMGSHFTLTHQESPVAQWARSWTVVGLNPIWNL